MSPQGRAALLASPGDSRHLAARGRRFSAASPGAGAWDLWDFRPHPYWANGGQVHGDPSSHWADSSPRAHDGHDCGERTQAKRYEPKVSGRPTTRGEQPQRSARHVLLDGNGRRSGAYPRRVAVTPSRR